MVVVVELVVVPPRDPPELDEEPGPARRPWRSWSAGHEGRWPTNVLRWAVRGPTPRGTTRAAAGDDDAATSRMAVAAETKAMVCGLGSVVWGLWPCGTGGRRPRYAVGAVQGRAGEEVTL